MLCSVEKKRFLEKHCFATFTDGEAVSSWVEMKGYRTVMPGEVDSEIDRTQLFRPKPQLWDAEACVLIYRRYVAPGMGAAIPDKAFCDVAKSAFLDYVATHCSILLMGSRQGNLTCLKPMVLSQNLIGWDRPRYVAFNNSIEAIHHAILDVEKLAKLGYATRSTVVLPEGFYFGLDYRAVGEAPWQSGTVYLYRATDFPEDYRSQPFHPETPIRPLARIHVSPADWPMLDQVLGANLMAQIERQQESFVGYPWRNDQDIHPGEWKRPLAEAMRAFLDQSMVEPLGLIELGKRIGASPSTALRIFRAVMGQSPREYLTGLRVSHAKGLLRKGLPIAEVAVESGFYDQTHFTRHFRQQVGMTPGQYLRAQESPIHHA